MSLHWWQWVVFMGIGLGMWFGIVLGGLELYRWAVVQMAAL